MKSLFRIAIWTVWCFLFSMVTSAQVHYPCGSKRVDCLTLVRVTNPGALSEMPGMAMPTTFPNTYASTIDMSFDPNLGSAGTLYLNYTFTGTTQSSPMCNQGAHHYPVLTVHITRSGSYGTHHSAQGYQVAPCVQMNQQLTLAFDLGADQCNLSLLMDNTCAMQEDTDQIQCTVAGGFALFIKGFEFESATTVSQVVGIYPPWLIAPWCAAPSDPPDWKGPVGADSFGTGYWVSTNAMSRTQIWGKSFYGVPWKPLSPIGPAGQWPSGGPKPICTMWDHGCSFVDQYCTAKLMPPSGPGRPDAVIENRNA